MKKRVRKIELSPVKVRATWAIKPVTRIKESKKRYSRKGRKPEEPE